MNLFTQPKVEQIALFQQKSFLYKNTVVNFSDALPTANLFLGLSHYLAKIYDQVVVPEPELRASYTEDHTSRWPPAFRNLLWFDPQLKGKLWPDQNYYLKESQWLISRHSSKNEHFSFAAKGGGHNDEPHNHNDLGHFILQRDEEVFFKDLGSGEYNDAYFGKERYSFLCNGSHGHSVPIINGKHQQVGPNFYAIVKQADLTEKRIDYSLDLTNAYAIPTTMKQFLRTFTWEMTGVPTLSLTDEYTFTDQPTSIVERFMTPILTIEESDEGIILQGKEKLLIQYNREQLAVKRQSYEFINHFGKKETVLALAFYVNDPQPTCTLTFTFQFFHS